MIDPSGLLASIQGGELPDEDSAVFSKTADLVTVNAAWIIIGLAAWWIMKQLQKPAVRFGIVGLLFGVILVAIVLPAI